MIWGHRLAARPGTRGSSHCGDMGTIWGHRTRPRGVGPQLGARGCRTRTGDTGMGGERDPGTGGSRDKGTQGQRDRGTVGPRDSGTGGQGDSGTQGQQDSVTGGQADSGTQGEWDRGTGGQRDTGTPGSRGSGTVGQGDRGTRGHVPLPIGSPMVRLVSSRSREELEPSAPSESANRFICSSVFSR